MSKYLSKSNSKFLIFYSPKCLHYCQTTPSGNNIWSLQTFTKMSKASFCHFLTKKIQNLKKTFFVFFGGSSKIFLKLSESARCPNTQSPIPIHKNCRARKNSIQVFWVRVFTFFAANCSFPDRTQNLKFVTQMYTK